MLKSLTKIFETHTIETNQEGKCIPRNSNIFILEKYRKIASAEGAHLVVEPDNYWVIATAHNHRNN